MKPKNLAEAIEALDKILSPKDQEYFSKAEDPARAAILVHHTLGRHLRNTWGLWDDSELAQHMCDKHNITHPDDMSHFIIEQYIWRKQNKIT